MTETLKTSNQDIEHPEETERKRIAAQVQRISKRLVERAKDMPQVIVATNSPENTIHSADKGTTYVTQEKKSDSGVTSFTTSHNGLARFDSTALEKSVTSADRNSRKRLRVGRYKAGVTTENRSRIPSEKEFSPMTNEETIHVAAGILSKFRGELSKRSIDHTKHSKNAHDDLIDA